jgi:hypothetical protein
MYLANGKNKNLGIVPRFPWNDFRNKRGAFLFHLPLKHDPFPSLKESFMKMLLPILILFSGFEAAAANPIDILFVVDNSGSMTQHQKNLSAASTDIDKALSKMKRDFHIGVISMDTSNTMGAAAPGALLGNPRVLTPRNLPGALAKNLLIGTNGSMDETPFDAVQFALSSPNLIGINKGFLRANTPLAIVFLTDAEDQSLISVSNFRNILVGIAGHPDNVTVFSWIVPSSTYGCDRDQYAEVPVKIEDLTRSLNGEIYNLCEMTPANIQDFARKLAKFGKHHK